MMSFIRIALQQLKCRFVAVDTTIGTEAHQDGLVFASDVRVIGLKAHQKTEGHRHHGDILQPTLRSVDCQDHGHTRIFHEHLLNGVVLDAINICPYRRRGQQGRKNQRRFEHGHWASDDGVGDLTALGIWRGVGATKISPPQTKDAAA